MFDLLSRYLLEHKKILIPQVGSFELEAVQAATDFANETIAPPSWVVNFDSTAGKETAIGNDDLYNWLSLNKSVSREDAVSLFTKFSSDLKSNLDAGLPVKWEGVGTLNLEDGKVHFAASNLVLLPFTAVSAKRVVRERSDYTTLVAQEKLSTASDGRDALPLNAESRKRNLLLWILLVVFLAALVWYFSQNG